MSYTEALLRSLCSTLWTSVVRSTAQDARFASWLQTPLPRNEYWDLVRTAGAPKTAVGADARTAGTKRPLKSLAGGRVRVIERPGGTEARAVSGSSAGGGDVLRTVAIATDARAAMVSVDASLGDERTMALRVMEDTTRRHFDFSQPGVVPKITQLLLVLALEPCQLSLEFVLRKRFDNEFVARNFLASDSEPLAVDDAAAWHRDVKRMAFNLFARFPELALNCDIGSDVAQLRAVQHLWCLAEYVFTKCSATLHSETAQQFAFNHLLDELTRDRAPLLEVVARANIYAAGSDPGRFLLRRDLFAEAFVCAQLHVLQLQAHAQPESETSERLRRSLASLKVARAAIVHFEL